MPPPRALRKLRKILEPAFGPCPGFAGPCGEGPHPVQWDPPGGHVPRGFCGAEGRIDEVKLVLVFAEPADPLEEEHQDGSFDCAWKGARDGYEQGDNAFYRNVRTILELCFPGDSFEAKMRKVWLTESLLCSAHVVGGPVAAPCWRECTRRYLAPQLALFPNALVVALGRRATERLCQSGLGPFMCAASPAPPGGLRTSSLASWEKIAIVIKRNLN